MMKNILFSAAICIILTFASASFVSCDVQPVDEFTPDDTTTEAINKVKCVISAHMPGTKTVNDGLSTLWAQDDELSVFFESAEKPVHSCFQYVGDDSFEAEIAEPDADAVFYAVYPYDAGRTSPANTVVAIPATLQQNGNDSMAHLAGETFPLCGMSDGTDPSGNVSVQMNQVNAVCRFVIKNGGSKSAVVKSIDFAAPVAISGSFVCDLTAESPVWSPVDGSSSNSVTLAVEGGSSIAPGASASFYLATAPFDVTGDFVVTVVMDCNGETMFSRKVVQNTHIAIPSGQIKKINYTLDPKPMADRYVHLAAEPDNGKWDGKYLVVNTSADGACKVWNPTVTDGSAIDATISGGVVGSSSDLDVYAVQITDSNKKPFTYDSGTEAYDVTNSKGQHVFASSGSIILNSGTNVYNGNTYWHAFLYDAGGVRMRSARENTDGNFYYLSYSTSTGKYAYQKSVASVRVHLFRRAEVLPKENQTLSFEEPAITWTVGQEYEYAVGGTYPMPQTVSGAHTEVNYTSSSTDVVEFVGSDMLKINGFGTATITATAASSEVFNSATAVYSITVSNADALWRELGTFELLNDTVNAYLDEAAQIYTDSNWQGTNKITVMNKYPQGSATQVYDTPNPVVVPVDGHNNATATIDVYNDEALAHHEISVTSTVTSGKVNVYNLIPGRTYYYTVSVGGNEIDRGKFSTTGRRRYMRVSDEISRDRANNCRDLGGMKTRDGKTLKYNKIFRGTNVDGTTSAEKSFLTGYMGVRRDVDLRLYKASDNTSRYAHRSLPDVVSYSNYGWDDISSFLRSKSQIKGLFSDIISTVTSENGGSVYIHCWQGADRTGFICVVLEAILGVSEKDTSIDYELTSFSICGSRWRDKSYTDELWHYFDGLENVHTYSGKDLNEKAENFLLNAGITQQQLSDFRDAMLE